MTTARLTAADGLGVITLSDPRGRNALDPASVAPLRKAVDAAYADPGVRVIVLRSAGGAFCTGGDIAWFAARPETLHDEIVALTSDVTHLIGTLHGGDKIAIAAVGGAVAGAGLGLALACDLIVAARPATFTIAYRRIGASPDLGVSAFLARDLGYRRALELCLSCEDLTADRAHALGLVSRVVEAGELDAAALELAARIADGPAAADATTKRLLRAAARADLDAQLADELRSVAELTRTRDWAEGIAAFLERREPSFGG